MLENSIAIWNKIRYLIKSQNNNADDYDKNYMKINFNSDEDLQKCTK